MEPNPDHAHCADAVERLYVFLDGELDELRMADVKKHLDECLPCLEAFDFEAELRQLLARKCRDDVPESLRARIVAAIQVEYGPVDDAGGMLPS